MPRAGADFAGDALSRPFTAQDFKDSEQERTWEQNIDGFVGSLDHVFLRTPENPQLHKALKGVSQSMRDHGDALSVQWIAQQTLRMHKELLALEISGSSNKVYVEQVCHIFDTCAKNIAWERVRATVSSATASATVSGGSNNSMFGLYTLARLAVCILPRCYGFTGWPDFVLGLVDNRNSSLMRLKALTFLKRLLVIFGTDTVYDPARRLVATVLTLGLWEYDPRMYGSMPFRKSWVRMQWTNLGLGDPGVWFWKFSGAMAARTTQYVYGAFQEYRSSLALVVATSPRLATLAFTVMIAASRYVPPTVRRLRMIGFRHYIVRIVAFILSHDCRSLHPTPETPRQGLFARAKLLAARVCRRALVSQTNDLLKVELRDALRNAAAAANNTKKRNTPLLKLGGLPLKPNAEAPNAKKEAPQKPKPKRKRAASAAAPTQAAGNATPPPPQKRRVTRSRK